MQSHLSLESEDRISKRRSMILHVSSPISCNGTKEVKVLRTTLRRLLIQHWSRALLLGCVLLVMTPGGLSAQTDLDYPRLANMYLHGSVDPTVIPALAQWDQLILSTVWTQQDLQSLRTLNPDIRLFLYVCGYCVETQPPAADPWSELRSRRRRKRRQRCPRRTPRR